MAPSSSAKRGQGRPASARVEFLYKAAAYLSTGSLDYQIPTAPSGRTVNSTSIANPIEKTSDHELLTADENPSKTDMGEIESTSLPEMTATPSPYGHNLPMSRMLLLQMREVSLKSQIRLPIGVKRSVCKRCHTLLVASSTATISKQNLSRGGRKPWADVFVTQCNACGAEKRVPVGSKRQHSNKFRRSTKDSNDITMSDNAG
ncbi:MAG: hypothetical protein M1817_003796 [Caeruleum heppii]|nr:MAG: hypothetical protein M1817_003796 [Caeruleum heppii]